MFEGDARGVILALNGDHTYEDWRSSSLVKFGWSFVNRWPLWSVNFVPRQCNSVAYNLAQWAANSNFSGFVPSHRLPIYVVQDMGTSVVNLDADLDCNEVG